MTFDFSMAGIISHSQLRTVLIIQTAEILTSNYIKINTITNILYDIVLIQHTIRQECNLSLYCGSLLPMCCYPYLHLYIDICSHSEEDLSCLCVSTHSCQHESCDTMLTRGEGGGERCDGERTVHV